MQGFVHSFESLAAVDGEGLRCAVFLAGCPLRCACCHNPDTWTTEFSKPTEAQEIAKKIARYKSYFGNDGGVTFSGGEPLIQAKFINEIANFLKEQEIGYAIDTSGAVELTKDVKLAVDNASHVILDLKFWDNDNYLKYTGSDMTLTMDMLDYLEEINKKTWIRTVIIPGINDTEEIISKYAELVSSKKCVKKYELLAFHTMGFSKYKTLGIPNFLEATPPLDYELKDELQRFLDTKLNI